VPALDAERQGLIPFTAAGGEVEPGPRLQQDAREEGSAMTDARPVPPGLQPYWTGSVQDFVTLPPLELDDGLKERHGFYSMMLAAILASQFNGNKHGESGDYGTWRKQQLNFETPDGSRLYRGGTYLGHNIAALAVDAAGRVIDYDFNHNDVFNSSVEHAESRLIRRLFSLAELPTAAPVHPQGGPATPMFELAVSAAPRAATGEPTPHTSGAGPGLRRKGYSTLLTDVTIYTSLESCAQCSGIMALADLREVVYLQYDQGQYLIGNMMYRATAGPAPLVAPNDFRAPLPVPGDTFGSDVYDGLNLAFREFAGLVGSEPFYRDGGFVDRGHSVTSFLCTDSALSVFEAAGRELEETKTASLPDYRRPTRDGHILPSALTNADVLQHVKGFLHYARTQGGRGTAHRV
jgi:tRNA(Arg) A34 adenosine deaminase TadA